MDAFTPIDVLRASTRACAEADDLLLPVVDRQHRFEDDWAKGVALAKYESGGGDDVHVLFGEDCALLLGFAHESLWSPFSNDPPSVMPGMFVGLPAKLEPVLRAFDERSRWPDDPTPVLHVTFCWWRAPGLDHWRCGPVQTPVEARPDDDPYHGLASDYPLRLGDYLDCYVDREYARYEGELVAKQTFEKHGLFVHTYSDEESRRPKVPITPGGPGWLTRLRRRLTSG